MSSPSRRCAPGGVQQNWTQINLSLLGHFTLLMPRTQNWRLATENNKKQPCFFPPRITITMMFLLQKVVWVIRSKKTQHPLIFLLARMVTDTFISSDWLCIIPRLFLLSRIDKNIVSILSLDKTAPLGNIPSYQRFTQSTNYDQAKKTWET